MVVTIFSQTGELPQFLIRKKETVTFFSTVEISKTGTSEQIPLSLCETLKANQHNGPYLRLIKTSRMCECKTADSGVLIG